MVSRDYFVARSNNIFELMTNEPIDALLKTGGTPGETTFPTFMLVFVKMQEEKRTKVMTMQT